MNTKVIYEDDRPRYTVTGPIESRSGHIVVVHDRLTSKSITYRNEKRILDNLIDYSETAQDLGLFKSICEFAMSDVGNYDGGSLGTVNSSLPKSDRVPCIHDLVDVVMGPYAGKKGLVMHDNNDGTLVLGLDSGIMVTLPKNQLVVVA